MKIEGGYLPALAGLIPFQTGTVLPALRVGALLGLVITGVQKTNLKWVVSQEGRLSVPD